MNDAASSRRRFLQQCLAGAAVAATGSTACGRPDSGSETLPFVDAWGSAVGDAQRWRLVRDQFLLEPGYAYLNTGGLGPSPRPVIAAFDEAWRELELRCESGHGRRADVRSRACEFLGCGEDELAFTRSATEGMNLVARGLKLRDGDEVVMTTHEHPGGAMPWFAVREDTPIRIRTVDPGTGGDDSLQRLRGALTSRTRVVMVSHITCTTGLLMPVREIAELCRQRGIVCVIDGAQAVGQIPVDLRALGCEFYVASGHKWLLGPKGTGVLYVRDEMLDRWKPSFAGAYADARFDLAAGALERLRPASASEYGTRNTPLVLGLGAAFDFLSTMGMQTVAARGAYLAQRLREGLFALDGVDVLTPADAGAAILTFRLPAAGGDPWEWVNRLRRDHSFRLRPVGEAGLAAVRASTHVLNSEAEVDRLVDVLESLL
ncbi:MAG: aminotransferase class V-fold PLP-dependent enzyme [Gemmatimonadales bacterium]|jgi:selenocysteine lyase/cysteine desulfurase